MPLLETIRTALTAAGVVTDAWPCYIGFVPDVGQAVTLYYTGGFAQDTHAGDNRLPTFQLAVRSCLLDHSACETKIRAAMVALENQDLSGVRLLHAMGEPGQWNDAQNRTCMSVNFRAVVDA